MFVAVLRRWSCEFTPLTDETLLAKPCRKDSYVTQRLRPERSILIPWVVVRCVFDGFSAASFCGCCEKHVIYLFLCMYVYVCSCVIIMYCVFLV